jgi:hypothetical protein
MRKQRCAFTPQPRTPRHHFTSSLFRRAWWRRPCSRLSRPFRHLVCLHLCSGIELPVVASVPPFFIARPPPAVVPPSLESPVVVLPVAGPSAVELPAEFPLACARARVLDSANVAANAIVLIFMRASSLLPLFANCEGSSKLRADQTGEAFRCFSPAPRYLAAGRR